MKATVLIRFDPQGHPWILLQESKKQHPFSLIIVYLIVSITARSISIGCDVDGELNLAATLCNINRCLRSDSTDIPENGVPSHLQEL
uniref:Uncharacterized protein n=1 Tax=Aegilops tauschii TaxID=37682 RepID=R7WEJ1_AEGTA